MLPLDSAASLASGCAVVFRTAWTRVEMGITIVRIVVLSSEPIDPKSGEGEGGKVMSLVLS